MSIIKVQNGDYYDNEAVKSVIDYCHKKCDWWGGLGVRLDSIELAITDMMRVKDLAFKTSGKQLYHLEIHIAKRTLGCVVEKYNTDRFNEDLNCRLVAMELSNILFEKGFQNCFFKHNKPDDAHLHFVLNSVNYKTKAKLTNVVGFSNELYHYLRREYRYLGFDGPYFV